MHYLSLSRTTFDNLWWQAHAELCQEAIIWIHLADSQSAYEDMRRGLEDLTSLATLTTFH